MSSKELDEIPLRVDIPYQLKNGQWRRAEAQLVRPTEETKQYLLAWRDKEVATARFNELGRARPHMLEQLGRSLYYDTRIAQLKETKE